MDGVTGTELAEMADARYQLHRPPLGRLLLQGPGGVCLGDRAALGKIPKHGDLLGEFISEHRRDTLFVAQHVQRAEGVDHIAPVDILCLQGKWIEEQFKESVHGFHIGPVVRQLWEGALTASILKDNLA